MKVAAFQPEGQRRVQRALLAAGAVDPQGKDSAGAESAGGATCAAVAAVARTEVDGLEGEGILLEKEVRQVHLRQAGAGRVDVCHQLALDGAVLPGTTWFAAARHVERLLRKTLGKSRACCQEELEELPGVVLLCDVTPYALEPDAPQCDQVGGLAWVPACVVGCLQHAERAVRRACGAGSVSSHDVGRGAGGEECL